MPSTRSQIKVFQQFPVITKKVEDASKEGLLAAAEEAAAVAQAGASIDLEIEVIPPTGDVNGYSAGIKSRRTASGGRGGRGGELNSTPIAWFFDRGTLGKRTRALKRPRKPQWTVRRGGSTFTAHRGDVTGKGVQPERFFGRARTAGRLKLLERLNQLR